MSGRRRADLVFQQIGNEHVHLILDDLPFVDSHMLLLDPGAADVTNRFARPRETLLNGLLEADFRDGADLRYFRDVHVFLLDDALERVISRRTVWYRQSCR